jgi:anaerobic magnesium-protoporphyrin IX monomethyl ester cyclase
MSIYLVNPCEKRILDAAGDRIPIGLLSIGANLMERGRSVSLYDLNHDSLEDLKSSVKYDNSPVIGVSVYTSAIVPEALEIARQFKGKARLIAGGYHATAMPETLTPYFDSVVVGEGEEAVFRALETDGMIREESPNLNHLPSPAYDLVDLGRYGIRQSGKKAGTLITSRGCMGNCAFCGKLERKVRFEPTDKVLEQLSILGQHFNAYYFLDDVFTLKPNRMKSILGIVDKPYRVTTRADLLDEQKLDLLRDTGCEWVSLGIESGDDEILKRSRKNMTVQDNYHAVQSIAKREIDIRGFFIIGLPGESEKTARETIKFAKFLKGEGLTDAQFYMMTPFPGTPIWNNPKSFGIEIIDRDYTKYLEAGKNARCVINTEHLKAERIEQLVEIAREEFRDA